MSKRADPIFASEFDAITDIERLRLGYDQAGTWTLPQICWHCWALSNDVLNAPQPAGGWPASTPQQLQAQSFIHQVNATGWPSGPFNAPPGSTPPTEAGDGAVHDLIGMLRRMARYPHAEIAHPFFGSVAIADFRKFVLIHLAHHLAFLTPTKLYRRTAARYGDFDAMIADIARLRRGYTRGGAWSLEQICWHLNLGLPYPLEARETQEPLTDAQIARQARWDHYIAHGRAPAGFEAPQEMIPPATANDADIDALIERLHALRDFNSPFIRAAAGVMPIERARGFLLAHGWLHLSCLHPIHRRREGLRFASEHGVIADIKRLRDGHVAAGNWTLTQVCWHLAATVPFPVTAGQPDVTPTESQQKMQAFMEMVLGNGGRLPPGFQAPDHIVPPAQCDGSAIDDLIRRLEALAGHDAPTIDMGAFGTAPTAKCRQMVLGHCARHLSFLRPVTGPREGLRFASEDDAIADIQTLRKGYQQTGGWSLPQICWHLNQTMQGRMRPGPFEPDSAEQIARRSTVEEILASGELPKGIVAPPTVSPPADAGDEAIDACLATLERFKAFQGNFAPHRLFGTLPNEITHRQNLIHVAHHLSHLIPTSATTKQ